MRIGPTLTSLLLLAIVGVALTWADPPAGVESEPPVKIEPAPAAAPTSDSSPRPDQPAPLTSGTDVIVSLLNRQRFSAVFVAQDDRTLTVRIGAIETRIPMDQVERVTPQRPAIERYHSMRSVIDDADVDRLIMLIEWLRANHLYEEALDELAHVKDLEPDNPDAVRLALLVEEERQLRDRQRNTTQQGRKEATTIAHPRRPLPADFPLLSDEQLNLLKVWEIDLANSPKIIIERATIDALLDRYGDDPSIPTTKEGRQAFHHRRPIDILEIMFRLRARDLYGQVNVLGMPQSLKLFRDNVNATWLINNCSTTRCHGGVNAPALMLYNRQPRAERSAMTNYLILERSTMGDGRPLIDYDKPNRSPLLQLGLPRRVSSFPHPAARGWKPVFRSLDARRYQQAVEWIRAMRTPRSKIPIDYLSPVARRLGAPDPDQSSHSKEPQPR